ncbi:hypothetical protein MMYC01_208938 [Madurella mycetomatis]|uniref:Heterokaryon incompatibility domain-containing protein n=1 Tax=Madurella mycetomatis TaxID=100816 RepID=A0A175VRR0_9PEZI|nr:hypothetical protein MMYC01_208938 [Madurella mycetomatis]
MNTIYGNAIITIVASTNSRPADGLPGVGKIPRSRFQIVKKVQRIPLAAAFHEARLPYGDIEDSVWKSRAWTFQERQLSRRAVYFTNTVPGVSADHRPTPLMDRSRFEAQVWTLMDYIFHNRTQTEFPNTFHIHGLGSQSVSMMSSDTTIPASIYLATPVPTHTNTGTLRIEGETLWKAYSDAPARTRAGLGAGPAGKFMWRAADEGGATPSRSPRQHCPE